MKKTIRPLKVLTLKKLFISFFNFIQPSTIQLAELGILLGILLSNIAQKIVR